MVGVGANCRGRGRVVELVLERGRRRCGEPLEYGHPHRPEADPERQLRIPG